jgi:hypothetical protein
MDWLPLTVVGLVILRLAAQLGLEALNRAEVRRHATQRPAALADVMDEPTYAKSVIYPGQESFFGAGDRLRCRGSADVVVQRRIAVAVGAV